MASRFIANTVRAATPAFPQIIPKFAAPQQQLFISPFNNNLAMMNAKKMSQQFSVINKEAHQQQLKLNPFKLVAEDVIEFTNRNKRKPRRANHGARPCSSVSRSAKKLRRHHYPK